MITSSSQINLFCRSSSVEPKQFICNLILFATLSSLGNIWASFCLLYYSVTCGRQLMLNKHYSRVPAIRAGTSHSGLPWRLLGLHWMQDRG